MCTNGITVRLQIAASTLKTAVEFGHQWRHARLADVQFSADAFVFGDQLLILCSGGA
jgi:hypothetical protein